jgi:hypothetical protein
MVHYKPGRRTIIDTTDDSYGPFGVAGPGQLAKAGGWEPGPMPIPHWPDPPPVSLELQERLLVDGAKWPATTVQTIQECLDMGGYYSGGLAQVIFYENCSPTSSEDYTLSLETSPVLEESAFTNVIQLAQVNSGATVAAGDVLSVWFGNFDETNSQPVARFLRWKLVCTATPAVPLFFSVRVFLKYKR